ncbi:hypothetical protein CLCR_07392 [Cladophialophora carrionii]|uniref:Uncharacterized protein n=1 Tax=Cladophialophora carrionii TaxID=86049 RepID=A0A1C1CMP7_9EURO|nr:hypothetical protein CLCR_07392 [Cladophialophora carrionii]
MSYSLPLSSIAELAARLRARSESEDEGEDVVLISGIHNSSNPDEGDDSPTSSCPSTSSSSSNSPCEGEWEDEWNTFQAAYADHAQSFCNTGDALCFDDPVSGSIGRALDPGNPVVGAGTGPEYLNIDAVNPNTGVCLNTPTHAGALFMDIAGQSPEQEQAHADTLWPTITPFPPRSTTQRQSSGKQLKQDPDGGLQMRILALWNLHQHNESLAARARAQAEKAAREEELAQRVMVLEYLHHDTKKTDGLHLRKPKDGRVEGYVTVIRDTFDIRNHLASVRRGQRYESAMHAMGGGLDIRDITRGNKDLILFLAIQIYPVMV